MSTRSGKRIHSTVDENIVDNSVDNKSERNTRSKRQKVNSELPPTEKKRKHYVKYPSEEDVPDNVNENIEIIMKSTRKSRRHTLKEQNIPATDSETSNDERKGVRSTRRTKKFEAPEETEIAETITEKPVTEGKKKGKKKKAKQLTEENIENIPEIEFVTAKKKSNKKKKRKSNSLIVEDISETVNNNLNKSNGSNDSFHSAAGSPLVDLEECADLEVSEPVKAGKKNKKNTLDEESNKSPMEKSNRKRKLTIEKVHEISNGHITDSANKDESLSIAKQGDIENVEKEISNLDKSIEISSKRRQSKKKLKNDKADDKNSTFEIENTNKDLDSSSIRPDEIKPPLNNTFDKNSEQEKIDTNLNGTFDKDSTSQPEQNINNITYSGSKKKRKSSIKNSTFDKIDNISTEKFDATFDKESHTVNEKSQPNITTDSVTKELRSSKQSLEQNNTITLNNTYDKDAKTESSPNSLNATFDKQTKLDTTFDKSLKKDSIDQSNMIPRAKSSLISSDTTDSLTINITDDSSRISITSDDSKDDNIANTTPVLIESSMDESKTKDSTFTTESNKTPLRREGTFTSETKDPSKQDMTEAKSNTPLKRDATFTESPKKINLPESKITTPHKSKVNKTPPSAKKITETKPVTPLKREGTFTRNSTEVPMSPNVKLSAQLTPRRKSLPSPGCTPYPLSKSSTKEKSVLNVTRSIEKSRRSSIADVAPRLTKVMFCSPVNNPVVVSQMKGKVIKSNLKGSNKSFVFDESVSELTRPARKRSYTQTEESERETKLRSSDRQTRPRTTSAAARLQEDTPSKKAKTDGRRTKLPNFAALHQKQFERMESLDECVARKAKRARHLLTPSTPTKTIRTSPKESQKDAQQTEPTTKKVETPKSKQPEKNPGFTRFGFKLNLDVNPFSVVKNTEVKPKEKPVILKRQATLPSLAGATTLRREIAKQTIMREKSFNEKRHVKRDETRTVIKGVRTNRRFELQMKMRNINNK